MDNIHLISTTAHFNDANRIIDYKEGFKSILKFKNKLKSISLIETLSNSKLEYLEDTSFKVYYSNLGNNHKYKGTNWLYHVSNYIENTFDNNDIVIFLTGRYKIINDNIFNLIKEIIIEKKFEFLAKSDGDIYSDIGVHTFFLAFTKSEFLNFSNWYKSLEIKNPCIEWDLKKYMNNSKKCYIIPNQIIMGVETNIDSNKLKKIC